MVVYLFTITLLHSERPNLYTILAFLSAVGLKTSSLVATEKSKRSFQNYLKDVTSSFFPFSPTLSCL